MVDGRALPGNRRARIKRLDARSSARTVALCWLFRALGVAGPVVQAG